MLANLIDVFRKVNAKSDPVVRSVRPPVSCKHCPQFGHTTRSCKVLSAEKNSQQLTDDDVAWQKYVITRVGCRPSYWKYNRHGHFYDQSKECDSKEQLQSLVDFWPLDDGKLANDVFNNYTRPCNKMGISYNLNYKGYDKPDLLKLRFRFPENQYQEIQNLRNFPMDSLWANIGGYVGMFCGYSLIQTPSLILAIIKLISKSRMFK